ncbi:UNVERIFIED_CONTAM: hypothetical protein HDU68_008340 [Siphonaria sp. JEL0065]|nr:hypothetical protein HDU68_008340 [Siphonaria sp. JEL0065]
MSYLNSTSPEPYQLPKPVEASSQTMLPTPPSRQIAPRQARPPTVFHGYVLTEMDAALLIEACINGEMTALNSGDTPSTITSLSIRSGMCVVFQERVEEGMLRRFRDQLNWSSSRIQGPFLLYREVQAGKDRSGIPNPEPHGSRFGNTLIRGDYHHVHHGLAKRTISLIGSNKQKYRVISYFYPHDVAHLYGDAPIPHDSTKPLKSVSQCPQFVKYLAVAEGSAVAKSNQSPSKNKPVALPARVSSLKSDQTSPNDGQAFKEIVTICNHTLKVASNNTNRRNPIIFNYINHMSSQPVRVGAIVED